MTPNELDRMAHELIADKIGVGEVVQMHWAVQELISHQGKIMGDGVEFYTFCTQRDVYRVVKNAVDKYDKSHPQDDRQMVLKGYECLQEAYTVERAEERQLVPIHLLSDEELIARAHEFKRQSSTLLKHAEELEQYVADRRKERAA